MACIMNFFLNGPQTELSEYSFNYTDTDTDTDMI